jgi:hypothetical protein
VDFPTIKNAEFMIEHFNVLLRIAGREYGMERTCFRSRNGTSSLELK